MKPYRGMEGNGSRQRGCSRCNKHRKQIFDTPVRHGGVEERCHSAVVRFANDAAIRNYVCMPKAYMNTLQKCVAIGTVHYRLKIRLQVFGMGGVSDPEVWNAQA